MTGRVRRLGRPCGGAIALLGVLAAGVLPAGPAEGQDAGVPGYDFVNLHALADGVTVDFNLEGFLPIEDLVGLSSITSESHYGAGRSDSLAALPDPGDLVLTLPGTLSALVGVSGVPDYPAAASADAQGQPVDDVQIAPDLDLGGGHLHAEAGDTSSSAFAQVGNQVDTVGLLPSFSVGTVRTTARTTKANETTLESVATSDVSNIKLLGGLLTIGHLTSEVHVEVAGDELEVTASKVTVSGATVAGTPVGITDDGIVGLGAPVALAPVIDSLVAPILAEGIQVRTTPATEEVGDRSATGRAGALQITIPLDVSGYPGTFTITFGRTLAELEVSALSTGEPGSFDNGSLDSAVDLPGLGSSTSDFGLGSSSSGTGSGGASTGRGATTELVSVPVGRVVQDWDLTNLYRVLLLGGIALFAAGQVIVRSTQRPVRRPNDLRQLWRW
jgi:hypothetical protein